MNRTENALRVATIKRPRKKYLGEAQAYLVDARELASAGQSAYDLLFGAAYNLVMDRRPDVVALYSNGMSEATMGAVDGFEEAGVNVVLMAWDWRSDRYVPIRRRRGCTNGH